MDWDPTYGFNVPTIHEDDISQLRRMAAASPDDYDEDAICRYAFKYPLIDGFGLEPDDQRWTPGYDLAAAAADIWSEKASCLATSQYDFSADGASYSRSQMYDQAVAQARYWMSKRVIRPIRLVVDHKFERDMQADPDSVAGQLESVAFSAYDPVINRADWDDDDLPDF